MKIGRPLEVELWGAPTLRPEAVAERCAENIDCTSEPASAAPLVLLPETYFQARRVRARSKT